MASKWQRKVLKGGATFTDTTTPFILRMWDGETVAMLKEFASAFPLLTTVYTRQDWRGISSALARATRRNELSHVVLQGLPTQGRRSAQCAIRRFEALCAWRDALYESMPPEDALAVIQRQVAYGKAREKLRKPRKTPLPKRPAPIAPIKNKFDAGAFESADITSIVHTGSVRTIRVFDEEGTEAWLLPRKTLDSLGLFSFEDLELPPAPAAPVASEAALHVPDFEEGPEATFASEQALEAALADLSYL